MSRISWFVVCPDVRTTVVMSQLNVRRVRQVYLITYSRASADVVPSRNAFAEKVLAAFEACGTARVMMWVCSQEFHRDGGLHYHMSVKLDKVQRWLRVRNFLANHYDVSVHFSSLHHNYYSAWKYVTKSDQQYLQSTGHPDLTSSFPPPTEAASLAVAHAPPTSTTAHVAEGSGGGRSSGVGGGKRKPRLTLFDVSQLVVQKNLQTRLQLLTFAEQQKCAGKDDLARLIVNRGSRAVDEAIKVSLLTSTLSKYCTIPLFSHTLIIVYRCGQILP